MARMAVASFRITGLRFSGRERDELARLRVGGVAEFGAFVSWGAATESGRGSGAYAGASGQRCVSPIPSRKQLLSLGAARDRQLPRQLTGTRACGRCIAPKLLDRVVD